MKTSIEQVWHTAANRVSELLPKSGEYRIHLLEEKSPVKIYGGIDSDGHLLMAIEVSKKPPSIEMSSAALDYFRQERSTSDAWLMVLRLRRDDLASVFGRLCHDLIDEIAVSADEDAVVTLIQERLAFWRDLFEAGKDGVLPDFRIKGLMAELLFMESTLATGLTSADEMVVAWVGPAGADQDFHFSHECVEVKAIGPNSEGVSISSIEQLDAPPPLRLSVWTLRAASPQENKAITLNTLVATLENRFAQSAQALATFKTSLLRAGYVEQPHYDEVAFQPIRTESFVIDGAFPKLTRSAIPVGITSANYMVALAAIR